MKNKFKNIGYKKKAGFNFTCKIIKYVRKKKKIARTALYIWIVLLVLMIIFLI